MAVLHLNGYITRNEDQIISLSDEKKNKTDYDWEAHSIVENIKEFAEDYGMVGHHNRGLGGTRAIIDDCNLRIYFTDNKCTLEEAMMAMDKLMYGGDIQLKTSLTGYSEYTITGMSLDEFSIGGHSLEYEIESHIGNYAHIILECED